MTRVAMAAEKMDHHPDWSNAWNMVTVDLCTHSAGGLTKNDFDLAGKMQQIQGGRNRVPQAYCRQKLANCHCEASSSLPSE